MSNNSEASMTNTVSNVKSKSIAINKKTNLNNSLKSDCQSTSTDAINMQIHTNTKKINQINLSSFTPSQTATTATQTCKLLAFETLESPTIQETSTTTTTPPAKMTRKRSIPTTTATLTPTTALISRQLIKANVTSQSVTKTKQPNNLAETHSSSNIGNADVVVAVTVAVAANDTESKQSVGVRRSFRAAYHDTAMEAREQVVNEQNQKSLPTHCSQQTTNKLTSNSTDVEQRFGCAHYKRRAMFVTPCCNKFYKCRFCHDENENHHFDRKTLTELICSECNTRQKVQECCEHCGVRFGKYTCLICNLFDDSDKQQYHCNGCGICRIGGAENFFHCEVCNMCLPIRLKIEGHRCVENISRSHCPVCLGDIHTSRIPCHIPDCGHLLHKMCFDQLLTSGHYTCPICQTSLIDMTALWEYLDKQAELMPMPKKCENQRIHIFCNDCHKTSKTKYHFIGLKCALCGAYNTTQDVKRRMSLVTDEPSSA